MESILSVLELIFWAWVGWTITGWMLGRRRNNVELKEAIQDLEQERLIALTIEVDQDTYFCYNSITKEFVCQGRDIQEIVKNFALRYPGKQAAIFDGDESAVVTLKQQMGQISENSSSIRHTS
jgi:3'-phosphoadenosine 5'-phosphosulfate sulfotransferase